MSADRLLGMLWLIVATVYALRGLALVSTGQGASGNTVPMLLALVLMKLYEKDGEDG